MRAPEWQDRRRNHVFRLPSKTCATFWSGGLILFTYQNTPMATHAFQDTKQTKPLILPFARESEGGQSSLRRSDSWLAHGMFANKGMWTLWTLNSSKKMEV
jgi:hypothetical protein